MCDGAVGEAHTMCIGRSPSMYSILSKALCADDVLTRCQAFCVPGSGVAATIISAQPMSHLGSTMSHRVICGCFLGPAERRTFWLSDSKEGRKQP